MMRPAAVLRRLFAIVVMGAITAAGTVAAAWVGLHALDREAARQQEMRDSDVR